MSSNMGGRISVDSRQTRIGSHFNASMSSESCERSSNPTRPSQCFRGPFGCAMLQLRQLDAIAAEQSEIISTRARTMRIIYVSTNEITVSTSHRHPQPQGRQGIREATEMAAVLNRTFYGKTETFVRENSSLLQDAALGLRTGSFVDGVFSHDVFNEPYVKP
ncbi:hypothetical protein BD309DRAFT_1023600 [Dichomitus squalens]|nr:hypothetical protein BD309DRAFT_1023600 [Dichomitus squalens]